jgi:hypothetical protein
MQKTRQRREIVDVNVYVFELAENNGITVRAGWANA